MSEHLATVVCDKDINQADIYVGSFSGGKERGKMLQLSVLPGGSEHAAHAELTEENVDELLGVLNEWRNGILRDTNPEFDDDEPNPDLGVDEYERLCKKHGSCTHCGTITDDGGHGDNFQHCEKCENGMYEDLVKYPEELEEKLEELEGSWEGCKCHDPRNLKGKVI